MCTGVEWHQCYADTVPRPPEIFTASYPLSANIPVSIRILPCVKVHSRDLMARFIAVRVDSSHEHICLNLLNIISRVTHNTAKFVLPQFYQLLLGEYVRVLIPEPERQRHDTENRK